MKNRIFVTSLLLLAALLGCLPAQGQKKSALDLSPAQWIWYPSGRVLQNTFVLFRKEFDLEKQPQQARGWILADSRYQLFVNGERIQWGPAPSDPRWPEADPVDLAPYLKPGRNVIACQVLFYGFGEGTWVMGKPGLLFNLDIDGKKVLSDGTWQSHLAKSWGQGQYKRSFLRTLQENFDATLFPYGWNAAGFRAGEGWLPAQVSDASAAEPSICNGFAEYMWEIAGDPAISEVRERSIPMMQENEVGVRRLVESAWIDWQIPAEEYFDVMTPDAYRAQWADVARQVGDGSWIVKQNGNKTAALTFDFAQQSVGWPHFTIEAPAGTVVELLVHEAHQPGGPAIINSHFNSWSRFVCKEGVNRFETFDFESLRWLQLHIRNYSGEVKISDVGMRRRQYPFPVTPQIKISDPALQKLMDAAVNTLYNSAQEIVVDGMARERQQYSGDGGHQLHSLYQAFGESRLPARFINTFSQGISLDGYFMDCWPAFDRLARVMERQMQLTSWGPILDHGVGFCFDNFYYYQYTADRSALEESFPRLLTFFGYLEKLRAEDGLLPVENIGVPSVWIDHQAYQQQRHKQCALNLYVSAMCTHALSPLCLAFGQIEEARRIEQFGKEVLAACVDRFWSEEERVFINNLPWIGQEAGPRYCDRSLSTAILFDQCPGNDNAKCVEILVNRPKEMGLSYPCNAVWPLWALSKASRIDAVLWDLRENWANMLSVLENNTIQEHWRVEHDSGAQWSHCAVAPLIMLYQSVAGVKPLVPGYRQFQIWPQLGDLTQVEVYPQIPQGSVVFKSKGARGNRELYLEIPQGTQAVLLLDEREKVKLEAVGTDLSSKLKKYALPGGTKIKLRLKFT